MVKTEKQDSTDVLILNSCIWSKVEKDTLLKAFIQGVDTSCILPKNSGKSIIYQMASLLHADMDRDGLVSKMLNRSTSYR